MLTRRQFLSAAAVAPLVFRPPSLRAAIGRFPSSRAFLIDRIDRTTVRVPYRETPRRAMSRELPHWRYSEIVQVKLRSGHVGFGETLIWYTWGRTTDEAVKRATGKNAGDLLWEDWLGAGLQTALFDAVARASDVPVHRLLGRQVHKTTPLSWWNIDMPPEDMASECREAHRLGYMSYKTKGRPWFDLWKQVELSAKAVPEAFKIDMDYNATLLTAARAIPILKELEKYPQVDIYESPIPQEDVAGNRAIREATRVKIALHYGTPSPTVVVREGVCDGFVMGGSARRLMARAGFCAEVSMPFWLQLVGTSITAAMSLHYGGVCEQALWPAVNCHQLYSHAMLTEPIKVENGFAAVPDGPGLGYELDRDAVEKLKVAKPAKRPDPPRLVEASWPDGKKMYFASGSVNFVLRPGMAGKIPFYERGVTARLYPDDGSDRWKELFKKAGREPVLIK